MEITIKWFQGTYPSFNVGIASKEGREPFLEIKGCKIMTGKNGEFVAGPSTKGKDDKYWNHTYFSKDFAAVVLEKAKESQPEHPKESAHTQKGHAMDDMDSDIPY